MKPSVLITLALALVGSLGSTTAASFYKEPPLFSVAPAEDKSLQSVDRFGPVGIGIELIQPAFVMRIKNVEGGSPAATTGKLKAGQIIESINGRKLADIDPRIQLGNIITDAEAKDGIVKLTVKDTPAAAAQEVVVKIPVMGAYSKTWPLDCPKSDKIVRDFADYLAKPDANKGFAGIGMLFLLSTGEDKDLAPVREWAHGFETKDITPYAWFIGYGGIPLCEYYLRTGDGSVLPTIQRWVVAAEKGQFLGGWAGRSGVPAVTYGGGGGNLNAGGTAVVTFLMLAKECGAELEPKTFNTALTHFFRWAGRGNNPYGDNFPEDGMVDNGKNGNLAFAMAAAASLTPKGEESIYAGARDVAALTSFYTTTFMLHGHTGGGIGEVWRSAAMGLLHDKRPNQYREFMDNRKWNNELSRRFDGSFGILGGAQYDTTEWGAGYALTYTVPRKTLRVTGAPLSKFAKPYQLPERPWGTKADDAFDSIKPAAYLDGTRPDFSDETLAKDSGRPLLQMFEKTDLTDVTLRRYAHHPDHFVRLMAARKAMGLNTFYLGKAIPGGGNPRSALVLELIKSKDPRVRRAALDAVGNALSGDALADFIKPEILSLVIGMLKDPEESWWVKVAALELLGQVPADMIAPQVDVILPYLTHEEWWLQYAALSALVPVVGDERCYKTVLPAIGELLRTCQRYNAVANPMGKIREALRGVGPAVQAVAAASLKEAYTGFVGSKTTPGGQDITRTYDSQMELLAKSLASVPGGYDVLYKIVQERSPNETLPYANIFLSADPEKFGPELKKAIGPIIRDQLVYEYIGKNWKPLKAAAAAVASGKKSPYVVGPLDVLTDLYRKVGVHEYDWHSFGPDLMNEDWDYFTFDPVEKLGYDVTPWRYRKVTYPDGMADWFAPTFDPAKAGWKKGQAPFGQYEGKLATHLEPRGDIDGFDLAPMRTLWDKEVLLLRGTFQFPPLKPGYIYRVRVGNGQHVGSGDGYKIYINGKPLFETKQGVGRREGSQPRGAFITKEFLGEFGKGPVTLAATSFLRYGTKAIVTMPPVPQGIFSVWLEEMEVPALDDEALRKSATVIPMLSSEWQDKQDPNNAELQDGDDRFRYDGKFVANPKVLGSWTAVALVPEIGSFTPGKKMDVGRAPIKAITFKDGGTTDSGSLIWSGEKLMDLERHQALKITLQMIDGTEYLVVETGGFSEKNPVSWKSQLVFLKRN